MNIPQELVNEFKDWKYISMFGHNRVTVNIDVLNPDDSQVSVGEDYLLIDDCINRLNDFVGALIQLKKEIGMGEDSQ
jgi:hypothetical protein